MTTRKELVTGNYTYLEGYHSGATASVGLIVPTTFCKEYEDEIKETDISFSELDGRHSETEGGIVNH